MARLNEEYEFETTLIESVVSVVQLGVGLDDVESSSDVTGGGCARFKALSSHWLLATFFHPSLLFRPVLLDRHAPLHKFELHLSFIKDVPWKAVQVRSRA